MSGGTSPLDEILHEAQDLGFIGPGSVASHREHAEAFAAHLSPARLAADLGTGGGLPGLVLAVLDPTIQWVFVEGSSSRAGFLERAVRRLHLEGSVTVLGVRAEVLGQEPEHRASYDLVTARSLGRPAVVAECSAPLLRPGGRLLVSEPPQGRIDERWPEDPMASLGFSGVVEIAGPPRMAEIHFTGPCPARFPRRVGVPAKRPFF